MKTQGFERLHSYSKGSKIYNNLLHKSIRSRYLLVEAENSRWENTHHSLTLILKYTDKSKRTYSRYKSKP